MVQKRRNLAKTNMRGSAVRRQPVKNDYSSAIGKAILVHLINKNPVKVFDARTGKISVCQSNK